MRRSKDLCQGQKMEPHDHRTPVGRQICAIESFRQEQDERDSQGLHQRDE